MFMNCSDISENVFVNYLQIVREHFLLEFLFINENFNVSLFEIQ